MAVTTFTSVEKRRGVSRRVGLFPELNVVHVGQLDPGRHLRPGQAVDQVTAAVELAVGRGVARETDVDCPVPVDNDDLGEVVVGVDYGVRGVAGQLDERGPRREGHLERAGVEASVEPVAQQHDRRALAFEGKALLLEEALDVVAPAV